MNDEDARWEARQEYAEELAMERRRKRLTGCLCGYPDWPGQCPGPASCPVHGEDLSDADSE